MKETYLHFSMTAWASTKQVTFSSSATKEIFFPLIYTFSRVRLAFFLKELNAILRGEMIMTEPWSIRDWNPCGDIWVDKEKVIYDLTENDGTHYHLEIPTLDFKELLENWNKFIEVNTEAFGK